MSEKRYYAQSAGEVAGHSLLATSKGNPKSTSGTGMNSRSRREFLRKALAVTGGALAVAGAADLGLRGLQVNPNAEFSKYLTHTTSSSAVSQTLLPDYLDFLEWMRSVSDKVPSKTADLSLEAEFAPYAVQARDPSFLEYSQVNTGYSELPYLIQLEAVQLAVSTKSPSYDVFSIDNQNIASFESGVISPNELARTYPELTYPKYDIEDFMSTVWDYVAVYPPNSARGGGGNSTVNFTLFPLDAPLMVFFYRKDIYDKLGLTPPTTWDEYYQQAQMLPGKGTPYASASMANADVSIIYEYLNHLASFGGSLWEIDGNNLIPALDSDKCLAALENFVRFSKYADPGSHNFTWTDVFTSLANGASATALLWHDYYNFLNDPTRSPVAAGKFVPAMNPAGPVGAYSTYGGAGLGVSRYSNRPEAAYLWIQWATCKGLQEMTLLDKYHIFPTRTSVFDVPEIQTQINSGTLAALNVAKKAWASGTTALTPFPRWLQVLVPLSTHINNAWTGLETPAQALTAAQNQLTQQYPNLTFA
jgi:multiple sugar transport system substrate-binding protein